MKSESTAGKVIKYILIILFSIMTFFPLLWMFANSFKFSENILANPLNLLPNFLDLRNFQGALELAPFHTYIWNSIWTSLVIVALQVLLSMMMGYALSRFEFKGKKALFNAIFLTYMLPSAATYVPSYVILAQMGLIDSKAGIIVSNIASVFAIYSFYNTFKSVPSEMIEAAEIDGATNTQILFKVLAPVSKSTIITTALVQFVAMYNNYMWPSLITHSKENYLISVGLSQFFAGQGNFADNLPKLMAANSIAVLPLLILFIVLQKWFIQGISDSGVKG